MLARKEFEVYPCPMKWHPENHSNSKSIRTREAMMVLVISESGISPRHTNEFGDIEFHTCFRKSRFLVKQPGGGERIFGWTKMTCREHAFCQYRSSLYIRLRLCSDPHMWNLQILNGNFVIWKTKISRKLLLGSFRFSRFVINTPRHANSQNGHGIISLLWPRTNVNIDLQAETISRICLLCFIVFVKSTIVLMVQNWAVLPLIIHKYKNIYWY